MHGVRTVTAQANAMVVYPNPLSGTQLTIMMKQALNGIQMVKLAGTYGRTVYTANLMPTWDQMQWTLPFRPVAGIYLLYVNGQLPVKIQVN